VKDAIESGIFNDLGSGSNVDVCVITKDNVEYLRNYRKPNERGPKEQSYKFKPGTTGEYSGPLFAMKCIHYYTVLTDVP
jgi:20S proteasome subunit beta 2